MKALGLIFLGGGVGALLRYGVFVLMHRPGPGAFPYGTLTVNVLGCLLIGILGALFAGPWLDRVELRLAVIGGLLGGFTTFSTFGYETLALLLAGFWQRALVYVVASNVLGLTAAWAGYSLIVR